MKLLVAFDTCNRSRTLQMSLQGHAKKFKLSETHQGPEFLQRNKKNRPSERQF